MTVYVILKQASGHHMFIDVFLSRKEAERYIQNHLDCYCKHIERLIEPRTSAGSLD